MMKKLVSLHHTVIGGMQWFFIWGMQFSEYTCGFGGPPDTTVMGINVGMERKTSFICPQVVKHGRRILWCSLWYPTVKVDGKTVIYVNTD
ncbi:hypothetical protein TNIN_145291 [Trichonephila inaurata madagascariensis]|uniref:Uncharacterized protein n=1 Tax=Trichonephila inaurata madagascariensis TaxID=2747483 RepID=A0A8X6YAK0_9ARAC|nr:hypothetical protein TNIN_145291 [Trichonephila inaurata madagascariensis]